MEDKIMAWDRLVIARDIERPNSIDFIKNICDIFIELHGDRGFKDDKTIIGGIGTIEGMEVTVIGIQKGNNINENIKYNFGMPLPEGYRKALRLMKQAEKFNRPVLCFVNTPGAYCGVDSEKRGQGEAIARNLLELSQLKTPIISIITGEGGSGGALALAVADRVWMLENSIYSVLSPEGFASILWKDAARTKEAAELMKITSYDLLEKGIIDKIIKEPEGGIQKDINGVIIEMKKEIIDTFKELLKKDEAELLKERYDKFRQIGEFQDSKEL